MHETNIDELIKMIVGRELLEGITPEDAVLSALLYCAWKG